MSKSKKKEGVDEGSGIGWWKGAAVFSVVIVIWICFARISWIWTPVEVLGTGGVANLGVFGDSFGAINALFAGLALAAFILTMLMQKHEIKKMIKGMTDQAKAMKDQATAMDKQLVTARDQLEIAKEEKLEARVFQVLELRHRVIEGMEYIYDADTSLLENSPEVVTARGMSAAKAALDPRAGMLKQLGSKERVLHQMGYTQAFDLLCDAVGLARKLKDRDLDVPGSNDVLQVIKSQVSLLERGCIEILLGGNTSPTDKQQATLDLLGIGFDTA